MGEHAQLFSIIIGVEGPWLVNLGKWKPELEIIFENVCRCIFQVIFKCSLERETVWLTCTGMCDSVAMGCICLSRAIYNSSSLFLDVGQGMGFIHWSGLNLANASKHRYVCLCS